MIFQRKVIIALVFLLLPAVLTFISVMLEIPFVYEKIINIRKLVFDKIMALKYSDFIAKSKDTYLSILTNDINNFEKQYFSALKTIVSKTSLVCFCLVVLLLIDNLLFVFVVIIGLFITLLSFYFKNQNSYF